MRTTLLRPFLLIAVLAGIAACQGPLFGPRVTAVVEVSGPNVFVNEQPAPHGLPLKSGDRVATGASSSALIRFSDGTSIQLAPDTDPRFGWSGAKTGGKTTVTMSVDHGSVWITATEIAVTVYTTLADIVCLSEVVVQVRPDLFNAYLLEGALLPKRPPERQLQPMEVLQVAPNTPPQITTFSPDQARSLRAIFTPFKFVPDIRMPSLEQLDKYDATRQLTDAGLKRGQVTEEQTGEAPEGSVLRQSIAPGTLVRVGTVVDLVVAVPLEVPVPDVVGLTLPQAISKLEGAGLRVGRIEGPGSDDSIVISQSPSGTAPEGSRVNLTVQGIKPIQ